MLGCDGGAMAGYLMQRQVVGKSHSLRDGEARQHLVGGSFEY